MMVGKSCILQKKSLEYRTTTTPLLLIRALQQMRVQRLLEF